MEKYDWYVLFPNHQEGLRFYKELKAQSIACTMVPTPRSVSRCCGMALMITPESVEMVKSIARNTQVRVEGVVKVLKKKDWKYRSS